MFFSCTNKTKCSNRYKSFYVEKWDSVFQYLVLNKDTLSIYKRPRGKDLSSYGYNLNRSIKGWSCDYLDLISEYKKNNLNYTNYSVSELQFLRKVISLEQLKRGDEIEVIKHWQQINNKYKKGHFPYFITNLDNNWQENLDSFRINVLENKILYKDHAFNIDSCEKDAFINIYNEIENNNGSSFFMAKDFIITKNRRITQGGHYFGRYFKKITIGYDEKDNITIELKNYLAFR